MSEALAEIREGFSKKEIKMAIGVASDPRYKQGNYSGAVRAIEKIKKGLSKHPQVAAVLKRQNENFSEQPEHEITVGDYTTKHFHMCGSAQTVMKKHADKEGAKELTMLQDLFYKMEMEAMEAGSVTDEQKKKSQILYDKIIAKAEEVGIKDEVDKYMKLHLDSMIKGDPKLGFGRTDKQEALDKEDEPKVKEIIKKLKGASKAHAGQADDLEKAVKEETELDEMKEPFVVVDTADGDKVVGTASSEKGAKEIITTAQLPPMKIKDKKTLKIVKVKKKQNIGYPLKEGTWAIPETPAQKRDLKRLMSKPLPLGKEGDNAANKMYSIIGDDVLFDDLYVAGKKDPEGDARPIIKKAMKRLKIREDRWFNRDTWRLDESTKPYHIKVFNSLKKGDKVEINYDSSIAGGSTKTFIIRTNNKVYKGKVDKVTMYPDGKTGGVKFHLYQYDNRPGVYMAIGDMGASLRDIKKL